MGDHDEKVVRVSVKRGSDKPESEGRSGGEDRDSGADPFGKDDAAEGPTELEGKADTLKRLNEEATEQRDVWPRGQEIAEILGDALDKSDRFWLGARTRVLGLLVDLAKEAHINHDRWIRSVADLDNFRKRTIQERSRLQKYRNEDLLRDLLPVVDNVDRALDHANAPGGDDAFIEGVRMIAGMFKEILSKHGVEPVEAVGRPFDPNVHEALSIIERKDIAPNYVVEELEKGYMYNDRLLRPSKVVVSKGGAAQAD